MAVSAGLTLKQIGDLLGHASPLTTDRYAHLVEEAAAAAAALVVAQMKTPADQARAEPTCSPKSA
jgi:integrase